MVVKEKHTTVLFSAKRNNGKNIVIVTFYDVISIFVTKQISLGIISSTAVLYRTCDYKNKKLAENYTSYACMVDWLPCL